VIARIHDMPPRQFDDDPELQPQIDAGKVYAVQVCTCDAKTEQWSEEWPRVVFKRRCDASRWAAKRGYEVQHWVTM